MAAVAREPRPEIPADIKRRVLVEAGHRCAILTCRAMMPEIHHIIPWAECREHKYENLIALCPNCHAYADRGKIDRKSLRLYKFNLRFAHDKFSKIEIDVLFDLGDGKAMHWPSFMHPLIRRLQDADYVDVTRHPAAFQIFDMILQQDDIRITDQGRQFLHDLGLREM